MQALVYVAHGELALRDVPRPQPGDGEVLVKVAHVGICGSELEGFASRSPRRVPPLIMGHEFCGMVADVGRGIHKLKTGDRVVVNPLLVCGHCDMCRRGASNVCRNRALIGLVRPGAFADYVTAPEHAAMVVDDAFPLTHGAMVEPLANAVHAARICGASLLGTRVLVMGAGTIGLCCLQVALVGGATRVAVVDVDDARLSTAALLGASATINARHVDVLAQADDVTDGRGFDFVLEAVGHETTRRDGVRALAPTGTAVWIGSSQDVVSIGGNDVIHHERRIQGSYGYTSIDFERSFALIAGTHIDVHSWVRQFPLADGVDVFLDLLGNKRPGLIKAQLQPS